MKECIAYLDGEENWHVVPQEELIRCKDCKLNGLCVLSHTALSGEGYCAWAEPKETK